MDEVMAMERERIERQARDFSERNDTKYRRWRRK